MQKINPEHSLKFYKSILIRIKRFNITGSNDNDNDVDDQWEDA